jgi:hypothetical protein
MCHKMLHSSSTVPVPPPALTSSVTLTVRDGVDNEVGVKKSESVKLRGLRKVERMRQIMIVKSTPSRCSIHTATKKSVSTTVLDTFMASYNTAICKTASAALRLFAEITGKMPRHAGRTTWCSTFDVQELYLLPNLLNGNLLRWVGKMVEEEICAVRAPKCKLS